MNLVIFTNCFPYSTVDILIREELKYHVQVFDKITILPLHYGNSKEMQKNVEKEIRVEEPLLRYNLLEEKVKLFFDGLFSFCPVIPFAEEFFVKKAFLKKKWLMNWLSATSITRALLAKKRFVRVLDLINRDTVLYFYWGDKSSGIIPFLRRKISNPIVVRFHGSDLYEEAKGGYLPYRPVLLHNLSVAVPISDKGYNYLISRYPGIEFPCKVFRLGVVSHGLNPVACGGSFHIVSCSNVIKLKRIHLIVEALKHIKIEVHWTHIGTGPLFQSIKDMCTTLPANVTTSLKGWMDPAELVEFYKTYPVDLFLNVSETEGIPVSIMEALSFGIPVFATDVGGVSEIVNTSVGKLVPAGFKPSDLADDIESFSKRTDLGIIREKCFEVWEEKFNSPKNFASFSNFMASLNHQEISSKTEVLKK